MKRARHSGWVYVALLISGLALAPPALAQGRKNLKAESVELGQSIAQALEDGNDELAERLARQRLELVQNGSSALRRGAYLSLGSALVSQGRLAEGELALNQALALPAPSSPEGGEQTLKILSRLAASLNAQGKLAQANEVISKALALGEQSPGLDTDPLRTHRVYVRNLIQLKQHEAAQTQLDKSLAMAKALEPSEKTNTRMAQLLELQSDLWAKKRNTPEALASLDQALFLFKVQDNDARSEVQRCTVKKAELLLESGKDEQALALLKAWHPVIVKSRGIKNNMVARSLAVQAQAMSLKKPDAALKLFAQALDTFIHNDAGNEVLHVLPPYLKLLKRQGQLKDALAVSLIGLDRIDQLFSQTQGLDERVREALIASYKQNFDNTLALLVKLHQQNPKGGYDAQALAVSSRMQSRIFTEVLRKADVKSYSQNPELMAKAKRFKQETGRLSELRLINAEQDRELSSDPLVQTRQLEQIRKKEEALHLQTRTVKQLSDDMWETFPRYMELTRPRPVTVSALQDKVLKEGDAVISYTLLDDALLIFTLGKNSFSMHTVDVERSTLVGLIQEARQSMESPGEQLQNLGTLDPKVLHRLYQLLIEPIAKQLGERKEWIVIGDGPLFTLPFEMLVKRWGPREQRAFESLASAQGDSLGQYRVLDYLGRNTTLTYLPSLSSLVSVRLYAQPLPQFQFELTSFANPAFNLAKPGAPASPALERAQRSLKRDSAGQTAMRIPDLPNTENEARELAKLLGAQSRLFLQEDAQEYRVKTENLSTSRFVHFATHGLLGDEVQNLQDKADNAQPALLLSLNGDMRGEDGLLTMSEILSGLSLNAELAVLSACNTAGETSRAGGGEGFAGLTRAFMFAGAHRLMVSHWSVESSSTETLVVDTFRRVKEGDKPSVALDSARRKLSQSFLEIGGQPVSLAHPYFWAPFVVVGD